MYRVDLLIPGFPGKTSGHGSLGWGSVALLRGHGQVIVIEPGSYNYRRLIAERLQALGVDHAMVTGVMITHCHWDHVCNYPVFPNAKIYVPGDDLEWALEQPPALSGVPELHVRHLAQHDLTRRVADATEILPGIVAMATPGHTPGHMAYRVTGEDHDFLFTGDAAKNRAELLSGRVDISRDLPNSIKSLQRLLEVARDDPSTVVVCGHDAAFRIEGDRAIAVQQHDAAITARLTTDFDNETLVSLVNGQAE